VTKTTVHICSRHSKLTYTKLRTFILIQTQRTNLSTAEGHRKLGRTIISNTATTLLRIGQEQSTSIWSPLTSLRPEARHMRDCARQQHANHRSFVRAHGDSRGERRLEPFASQVTYQFAHQSCPCFGAHSSRGSRMLASCRVRFL
jgi:hypothetical protein